MNTLTPMKGNKVLGLYVFGSKCDSKRCRHAISIIVSYGFLAELILKNGRRSAIGMRVIRRRLQRRANCVSLQKDGKGPNDIRVQYLRTFGHAMLKEFIYYEL